MQALRFDKQTVADVARLTELHLRFHGYGEGVWGDSAVRRYVTDAGPLLERLHRLTRSDCTTRNRRKAERLRLAYDSLEQRIAELREREELDAVRPDLDGNAIMELLGLPARAGTSGGRGPTSRSSASTAARCPARRRRPSCAAGGPGRADPPALTPTPPALILQLLHSCGSVRGRQGGSGERAPATVRVATPYPSAVTA
jgi:hypothetical protein